jgi:histidine triad (HIT) family protein
MGKMTEEDCIFCKIARKEIKKDPYYDCDSFCAFEDINPISPGHMLIIPKKHFVTLLDIPVRLGNEMLEFSRKLANMILDDKKGDGFNLVMNNLEVAGQVVRHAHIHLIPRKEGDGIKIIG